MAQRTLSELEKKNIARQKKAKDLSNQQIKEKRELKKIRRSTDGIVTGKQ